MTTTIFLHDAATLRVSFPYSAAAVEAVKGVGGATWDAASKTWRVPLTKLDALLRVFGDDCAVAPEVFLAASSKLPAENFAETCAAAGVSLRIEGGRVVGSGGCWTPLLQAEIDRRAVPLLRLLEGGWKPPVSAPLPVAPEPVTLDRITRMDHVVAGGERNAQAQAQRQEGYRAAALRKRMQGASHAATTQAGLFEEEVRG